MLLLLSLLLSLLVSLLLSQAAALDMLWLGTDI
jgi:hypothetical protein